VAGVAAVLGIAAALAGCGDGRQGSGQAVAGGGRMMHGGPNGMPPGTGPAATVQDGNGATSGRELFLADCGACHTLAVAGTSGTAGPNLDRARPSYGLLLEKVADGGGSMPAFAGSLTRSQIRAIARFVSNGTR
jgi:mono/diheme cytochrome c family protein